jgi:hypothetical protein
VFRDWPATAVSPLIIGTRHRNSPIDIAQRKNFLHGTNETSGAQGKDTNGSR